MARFKKRQPNLPLWVNWCFTSITCSTRSTDSGHRGWSTWCNPFERWRRSLGTFVRLERPSSQTITWRKVSSTGDRR